MPRNHRKSVADALAEIDRRLDADNVLSAEEKEVIRSKARKHVEDQRKAKLEKALLDQYIEEEERSHGVIEPFEDITVNVAPYTPYIMLDAQYFMHGLTYEVKRSQAQTLTDIMARTWEHQREIEGKRRKGDLGREYQNFSRTGQINDSGMRI